MSEPIQIGCTSSSEARPISTGKISLLFGRYRETGEPRRGSTSHIVLSRSMSASSCLFVLKDRRLRFGCQGMLACATLLSKQALWPRERGGCGHDRVVRILVDDPSSLMSTSRITQSLAASSRSRIFCTAQYWVQLKHAKPLSMFLPLSPPVPQLSLYLRLGARGAAWCSDLLNVLCIFWSWSVDARFAFHGTPPA